MSLLDTPGNAVLRQAPSFESRLLPYADVISVYLTSAHPINISQHEEHAPCFSPN